MGGAEGGGYNASLLVLVPVLLPFMAYMPCVGGAMACGTYGSTSCCCW